MECRDELNQLTPENQQKFINSEKWVDCFEENKDVLEVYYLSRGQIITLHVGEKDIIYDISNEAIDRAMNWVGVKESEKLTCAQRVRNLFFEMKDKEN